MANDIIVIITFVITIANSAAIAYFFMHFNKRHDYVEKKLNDLNRDTQISEVFSGGVEDKSLHDLANDLFRHVKNKYHLQAHSYNGLIKDLSQHEKIDEDLRDDLIDFFEHMIIISYKKESPHFEHEKDYLKAKLKIIVHFLEKKEKNK